MKKILQIVIITILGSFFVGCSYKSGHAPVNKKFFKESTEVKQLDYQEMGNVSLVENGWLFSSCDSMGVVSLRKLQERAVALGADAVINVRWQGEYGMQTKYPQCETRWGWVLLWPAWFIPGTADSTISGTMIKYN